MRKALVMFALLLSVGILMAELGTNNPTDPQLVAQRAQEGGTAGSGIFDIAVPPPGTPMRPVQRVPREKFGIVGPFPLTLQDLDGLTYPDATPSERQAMLEGMQAKRRDRGRVRMAEHSEDAALLAQAVVADHVHVLISFRPDRPLMPFIRDAKSESARVVKTAGGQLTWARGYYAGTLSHGHISRARIYIARQHVRHADRVPV